MSRERRVLSGVLNPRQLIRVHCLSLGDFPLLLTVFGLRANNRLASGANSTCRSPSSTVQGSARPAVRARHSSGHRLEDRDLNVEVRPDRSSASGPGAGGP
jgi:hypothetical protein